MLSAFLARALFPGKLLLQLGLMRRQGRNRRTTSFLGISACSLWFDENARYLGNKLSRRCFNSLLLRSACPYMNTSHLFLDCPFPSPSTHLNPLRSLQPRSTPFNPLQNLSTTFKPAPPYGMTQYFDAPSLASL